MDLPKHWQDSESAAHEGLMEARRDIEHASLWAAWDDDVNKWKPLILFDVGDLNHIESDLRFDTRNEACLAAEAMFKDHLQSIINRIDGTPPFKQLAVDPDGIIFGLSEQGVIYKHFYDGRYRWFPL